MKKLFIFLLILLPLLLFSCKTQEECRHDEFTYETVDADCDSEGYILNTCVNCSYSYKSNIIPAKGHTYNEEIFPVTCASEGYTIYSCECGYSYKSDLIAPLGHTLSSETISPTCITEGFTRYFCFCGYTYKSNYIEPKGHRLTPTVHAPTCTEEGFTTYTCNACDYSFDSNHTAPVEHKFNTDITAPTCTKQGFTTYTCSSCHYSFDSDYTVPKGHKFKTDITRPTSSSTGFTKFSCDCGYEYKGDYIMSSDIFHGAYVNGSAVIATGIDVSSWNGEIDWTIIKNAGIDFVIIKAGSTNGKDANFETNYKNAKAAGLDVGCYYYTYATSVKQSATDADMLMSWIAGKQFEYPIYYDIEDPSQESLDKELLTDMCKVFIEKMQSNGYFCGLYTNNNWLTNLLNTEKITVYFDVWLARWTTSGQPTWAATYGERVGLWQYSATGRLDGHTCDFDMNIAFKNYPELIKKWGYNGY